MGTGRLLALLLLLFAAILPLAHAIEPFSELSGRVDIRLSTQGSTVYAKATYLDLSYYKKDDQQTLPQGPGEYYGPGPTSTQSFTYGQKDLPRPKLYFTFNGQKVSGGGAAACDPVEGSERGEATCTITSYIDASGAVRNVEDLQSCGSVLVEFRGESGLSGPRPASQSISFCPRRNLAISALGPALESALSSPSVFPMCFPAMLVAGLLLASMYYSGRDPLSLFDLTIPRLPKVKPFRMRAGVAPQMVRSMAKRYNKEMMKSGRELANAVRNVAVLSDKRGGRRAKREAEQLFKEFRKALEAARNSDEKAAALQKYKGDVAALLGKYDPDAASGSDKWKTWDMLSATADKWLDIYSAMHGAKKTMGDARVPEGGGGVIAKKTGKFLDKVTNLTIKIDESKAGRIMNMIPVVRNVKNFPIRLFDVGMQFRSSKLGSRKWTDFAIIGTALYYAYTAKGKDGLRKLNKLGAGVERLFGRWENGKFVQNKFGKFAFLAKGFKWDSFVEGHDLSKRKANDLFNTAHNSRLDMAVLANVIKDKLWSEAVMELHTGMAIRLAEALKKDIKTLEKAGKKSEADALRKEYRRLDNFIRGVAEKRENPEQLYGDITTHLKKDSEGAKVISQWALMQKKSIETLGKNTLDERQKFDELLKIANEAGIRFSLNGKDISDYRRLEELVMQQFFLNRVLTEKVEKSEAVVREQIDALTYKELQDFRNSNINTLIADLASGKNVQRMNMLNRERVITAAEKELILAYVREHLANHLAGLYGKQVRDVNIYGTPMRDTAKIVKTVAASEIARLEKDGSLTLQSALGALATARMAVKYGGPALLSKEQFAARETAALEFAKRVAPLTGENGYSVMGHLLQRKMAQLSDKVDARFAKKLEDEMYAGMGAGAWSPKAFNLLKVFGKDPAGVFLATHLDRSGVIDNVLARMKEDAARNSMPFDEAREKQKLLRAIERQGVSAAEILLQKGPEGERSPYRDALVQAALAGRLGKEALTALTTAGINASNLSTGKNNALALEIAMKQLYTDAGKFARSWAAEMQNGISFYYGASKERADALTMLGGHGYSKMTELASEHQVKELAKKRTEVSEELLAKAEKKGEAKGQELRQHMLTPYSKEVEEAIMAARRYSIAGAQILGGKRAGGTWGENALGLLNDHLQQSKVQLGTLQKLYSNLVTPGSILYDPAFAKKMEDKVGKDRMNSFGSEAYAALMERGILLSDRFRGLAVQISGDKRGAIPLLEYDKAVLRKQAEELGKRLGYDYDSAQMKDLKSHYETGIIMRDRKGDNLRDLAPLAARLSDSWYSNLPSGVLALMKYTDSAQKESWQYRMPSDNPIVASLAQSAKSNPLDRQAMADALVGYYRDAKGRLQYDPSRAQMRMITSDSYTQNSKENTNKFFGDRPTNRPMYIFPSVEGREGMRTSLMRAGDRISEYLHSAAALPNEKIMRWYTAQTQVRFVMEAQATLLKEYGTKDRDRYKFEGHTDAIDGQKEIKEVKDILEKKARESEKTIEEVLKQEMVRMEKGKGEKGTEITKESYKYALMRNVASRTVDAIAEPERRLYAAELELRAIESIKSRLSAEDYSSLKSSLSGLRDSYRQEYKQAMKDYKGLQDTLVTFAGSHSDNIPYGSYRNIFNTWGLARGAFNAMFSGDIKMDSKFVYGSFGQFYQIAESSTMRDPRTATGTVYGLGFDSAAYVGYQTGQNVYERGWFWATQSGWEQQMVPYLNVSRAAHMFFNNFISYAARRSSYYPAYYEMDFMEPGKYGRRNMWQTLLAPSMLNINQTSDFFRARFQTAIDYMGVATLMGAYQGLGSQVPEDRTTGQKILDWGFVKSEQSSTDALWRGLQRPLDRYKQFERVMDDIMSDDREDNKLRDRYYEWLAAEPGSQEKMEIWQHDLKPLVKIFDLRPRGSQEGHSGRDIQEDGSLNRFMELYSAFHVNTWKPTVPGMFEPDTVKGRWTPNPQIASAVMHDTDMALNMSSFMAARYVHVETGNILETPEGKKKETAAVPVITDYLATKYDAMRDIYRRDSNALLHQIKVQDEWFIYNPLAAPTLMFVNPLLWAWANSRGKYGMHAMLYPPYTREYLGGKEHDVTKGGEALRVATSLRTMQMSDAATPFQAAMQHQIEELTRKAIRKADYFRSISTAAGQQDQP